MPPYFTDGSPVGPYKSLRMFLKSNSFTGYLFTESFNSLLSSIGINNHFINDPDFARKIFNGDGINGHQEMRSWWDVLVEYRCRLLGKPDALDKSGMGIMRDMNQNDPAETAAAKLARKRMMESFAPKNTKEVGLIKSLIRLKV